MKHILTHTQLHEHMYVPLKYMLLMQDFNEVQLIVVIEKQRVDHFDLVDKVYIPIPMNDFSESDHYYGMHGIARITLGYMFIIMEDQRNSSFADQGQ